MTRPVTFAVVLAVLLPFAATAQAAVSQASHKFVIQRTYEETVAWYADNRGAVYDAANCKIVKSLGENQYEMETGTPLGPCRFVVQEQVEQGRSKDGARRTTYVLQYVRNVRGRIVHHDVKIALTDLGGQTSVSIWMTTDFAFRLAPVAIVRDIQDDSLKGAELFCTGNR